MSEDEGAAMNNKQDIDELEEENDFKLYLFFSCLLYFIILLFCSLCCV